MNISFIVVTLEVSQLLISPLNELLLKILVKEVIGVVQQRERSSPAFLFEIKRALLTAVYVTPSTTPVSPELAPGQTIVTPFGAKEN
tara:strand:+ start:497 stop:757 length:261 start_codon:yes stop_codon:yes gene_type:complete